jgi:hypothetical protein
MTKVERDSIVNRPFKKSDSSRWESDKMDIRYIVLEHNAYLLFTWYKKLSKRRRWMQIYVRICVESDVENMTLPDPRYALS